MTENNHDAPRLRLGPDPEEEALHWIVRMTSGEASAAEQAAFAAWRAVPENDALYSEVERIWGGMGEVFERPDNVVELRPRTRRFAGLAGSRGANWGTRVAGIAACLAVLGFTGHQYATVWQYDQATQGSARGHAELADGSKVELNTGSAIDIAYADGERRVTLARGEAFFDVRRDPAKPFVVKAGAGEVRVLGTAFSVARVGGGARVTVIRGKVRVSSQGRFVDITPNQQVTFDGGVPGAVASVDADALLAWSKGRLVLQNRPLGEVIAEVDRYYPGMIVLMNDKAAKRRVNAVVDLNRIDEWLSAVTRSQGVSERRVLGVVFLS